ncbi:NERD domain-containing protein [Amycolatopsis sp. A1MSW2902]|uniref:NERD domain-containing protein n=1 Tax=Amycolatopsis sp. A1MSW2902 TaxID=687413 RepID=UPI00307CF189
MEVFWGDRPNVGSELRFLEQLTADLESSGTHAIVLANFFTERASRQIDFLVITDVHVCHVELKNYSGQLVGHANGLWSSRRADGVLEEIDRQNPYVQALEGKFALSDDMHALAARAGVALARKYYTQFDSVVCVFPRLAAGSEVPDDFKVRTLGYADFLTFLRTPGRRLPWDRDRWAGFIRAHRLAQGGEEDEVDANIAGRLVRTYARNLGEFYRTRLHELVGVPWLLDDGAVVPVELLRSGVKHAQLIGPSGAGKSHLAKHLALAMADAGFVPILVDASMYEDRLSALLNRSVGRFVVGSADELLRAAAITGQPVFLLVDGFNECPARLQERLLGDLAAFWLRTSGTTLITSQEEVPLPGPVMRAGPMTASDKAAILESYGGPEILELCEPFSTPYELAIASECASEVSASTTRATLLDGFIRKRVQETRSPADVRAALRRVALAMDERLSAWLSVDVVRRLAEQAVVENQAPSGVVDDVLGCSLFVSQEGRLSFSHELLSRFLVAEELLVSYRDPAELVRELARPRHRDLLPVAVSLASDAGSLRSLFDGLADAELFADALHGDHGALAAQVVRPAALSMLGTVTETMADATFAVGPEYRLTVTGGHQISDRDGKLLAAVGRLVRQGHFVDEVVTLLDATDAACRRSVGEQPGVGEPSPSDVVAAVLVGLGPANVAVAARIILDGCEHAHRDTWLQSLAGIREISDGRIAAVAADASSRSYGRLLLLCCLLSAGPAMEGADLAPDVFRLAWESGAYHVQLEGLRMIQGFAACTNGFPQHDRIVSVLDELAVDEIHPVLSTQLVDTMNSFGMVTSDVEPNHVSAEISALLRGGASSENRLSAYYLVTSQFDDFVGEAYFVALEKLDQESRTLLFTMAALGAEDGFWTDWILRRLCESDDRRALPAFLRWTTQLDAEAAYIQGVASCYVLGLAGCARFLTIPPLLRECRNREEEAWQCLGGIAFWLFRAEHADVDVAARCEPMWERLRTDLAPAAADALFWFSDPAVAVAVEDCAGHDEVSRKVPGSAPGTFRMESATSRRTHVVVR